MRARFLAVVSELPQPDPPILGLVRFLTLQSPLSMTKKYGDPFVLARHVRYSSTRSLLCAFAASATISTVNILSPTPALAAGSAPAAAPAPSAAPASSCALAATATATAGGQSFSITTSPHVIVAPTILAQTHSYTLALNQTGTEHWTATVDGQAASAPDVATLALDNSRVARDVVLQSTGSPSCSTHVIVLQFGSAFTTAIGDPPGTALSIADGPVSAIITADGNSPNLDIKLLGGAATGFSFHGELKAAVTTSGLAVADDSSLSVQQGRAALATVSLKGVAVPTEMTTTCSVLAALVQAVPTLQVSAGNAMLHHFGVTCNAAGADPTLTATFESPRFFKRKTIQATLGASGTTLNLGDLSIPDGSSLKGMSVAFEAAVDKTPASAVVTASLDTPAFTTTPISMQVNDDGLKLYGAANSTAVVSGKKPHFKATITDLSCPFDTATLTLARCNGAVQLDLPHLAGPLSLGFTAQSITAAGSQDIPLGNDYTLSLKGLSVKADPVDKELIVAAKSAAIIGAMLGPSGIGVRDLRIDSHCITGAVTVAKTIPAGAFTFANLSGRLNSCYVEPVPGAPNLASSMTPQGLSVVTDATLNLGDKGKLVATDPLPEFSVALNRLGILIPVNGGRLSVTSPQSVKVTGKLLGRTLVGVCPAALVDPLANSTGVNALPSVALGQKSAAANDIPQAGRFFQVTADGGYELCVGIHVTADSANGTPPTGTTDLANARLLFTHSRNAEHAMQKTGDIALQTASLHYAGSGISTRLGANSFGITSLDLTYDAADTESLAQSGYAESAHIPLNCHARLYGDVTMKIQSLTAVATSTATIDTQLGFGNGCLFADMSGSVSIPVGANSVYLRELHFGMGPHSDDPAKRVSFVSVTGRVYIGQGGFAFKNSGFTDLGNGARPAFHPDTWGTVGMNVGWIISGIGGFITGTIVK